MPRSKWEDIVTFLLCCVLATGSILLTFWLIITFARMGTAPIE